MNEKITYLTGYRHGLMLFLADQQTNYVRLYGESVVFHTIPMTDLESLEIIEEIKQVDSVLLELSNEQKEVK